MMKNLLMCASLATALVCAAPAAWAQSKTGQDKAGQAFLKKAIEANFAEIEMGKLAQQKGGSEDVKSFGKMLQDDHSKANDKAMSLAKDMGMTPPTGPNAKQKKEYDNMAKMSGDKFDSAFAKHMVADHKKDIKEFQNEAKKNEKPSGFANEVLPDLQKHLQTAQQIEGKGKTTGSR